MSSECRVYEEAGRKWILPHMFFFGGLGEGIYLNLNCFYEIEGFQNCEAGEWYVYAALPVVGYGIEYHVRQATGNVGKVLVIYPTVDPPERSNVVMLAPRIIRKDRL